MLPEENENPYGKQTWIFHVQSAEDFYNQLRAAHLEDLNSENEIDLEDLTLAKTMLKNIGINL